MTKELLIIFTRNPELGKVKTRLAKTVGDKIALNIYSFLVEHTREITADIPLDKVVYYSEYIPGSDGWDPDLYNKALQQGTDLGACMYNAFKESFEKGYERVVIIGSDIHDLHSSDIRMAFSSLETHDYVIGPAQDGGYYLLGMKSLNSRIFEGIEWGTDSVYEKTLSAIDAEKVYTLEERNDIDYFEDIKDNPVFYPFIKNLNVTS